MSRDLDRTNALEYLVALKKSANRLTQELNFYSHPEDAVDIRMGELSAAIQRLEWELERCAREAPRAAANTRRSQ